MQLRTGWADGPAYITQCPIRSNQSYTYRFKVIDQRGTLWWHAHISWQRASVHGAFIIYPRHPYPFSIQIKEDIPIILGKKYIQEKKYILVRIMDVFFCLFYIYFFGI